jgi:hypothetical protein
MAIPVTGGSFLRAMVRAGDLIIRLAGGLRRI